MGSFWMIGSLIGASGVAMGALGAHWVKKRFNDVNKSKSWEIAAHYQIAHAMPILLLNSYPAMSTAGWLLTSGVTLFSGSIYGLVLVKSPGIKKILGPITPIGGVLLIAGWVTMAFTYNGQ